MILVQNLQDNCNESINLEHTDTITLKRVYEWSEKGKSIQIEKLSNDLCIRTIKGVLKIYFFKTPFYYFNINSIIFSISALFTFLSSTVSAR